MRRFLPFVTFALAVAFLLASPLTSAEAKRLPVKERKKMADPFKLLTLDQFAKLAYWRRVQYVREMRRAVVDAEKMQYLYRFGKFSAGLESVRKNKDLYALLFGADAYAQTGGRGRNVTDQCIYAFWLSDYGGDVRPGGQAYECERAQFGKCTPGMPVTSKEKAVGDGALCRMELSGLDPRNPENCIPRNIRYKATSECENRRIDNVSRYQKRIKDTLERAKAYFKVADPEGKIKPSDLDSEGAARLVKELVDNSFDHEVWANLAYVAVLYKRAGKELPTSRMGYPYNSFTIAEFDGIFQKDGVKINQLYKDYRNHCEDKVDSREVDRLLNSDCLARFKDKSGKIILPSWLTDLELRRCEAAKAVYELKQSGASNADYTVERILEIDECRIVKANLDSREKAFDNIAGSYPDIGDDAPANDPPPPAPAEPEPEVVATGCSTNVVRDEHLLFQPAARCLICPAETTTRNTVSRKWFSLMSTMVLACGEGAFKQEGLRDGKYDYVTLQALQKYIQTFGHCSQDTYDWHQQSMRQEDFDLVKKWQTNSYWNKDTRQSKDFPDISKNFARVYGISYDQASRLFCDNDRFKKRFFSGKVKGYDDKDLVGLARLTESELGLFMAKGRKRMEKEKRIVPDTSYSSPADALKQCMDESLKVAGEEYSDSNNCIAFTSISSPNAFERMVNEVKAQEGVVLADSGLCWNAKQHEKFEGKEGVSFVDSSKIASNYERVRMYKPTDQDGGILPSGTMEVQPKRQFRGDADMTYLNVSYNNRFACPITAGNYGAQEKQLNKKVKQENKATR